MTLTTLDERTQKNVLGWLNEPYDSETKAAIQKLLVENPKELIDAFYTTLEFGTGGLRGLMGVGCNRMNIYTVMAATQGLANYIQKQPKQVQGHSVLIGYDSRHQSRLFAETAAKVLAANGIKALIFNELRPTPLISFGCRHQGCTAAIMITASHNPPQYNGYKVYWSDGGQILPPHDRNILQEIQAITSLSAIYQVYSLDHPLIQWIDREIDVAYIWEMSDLQRYPEANELKGDALSIVYTSLHGTGITLMPSLLASWGFSQIQYVDEQVIPDGNFSTVTSPNPEDHHSLFLGLQQLKETNADILLATDPDADRLAVAVNHNGEMHIFNGNQLACICLYHLCQTIDERPGAPMCYAVVKTIATTELFQAIADSYQLPCYNVLPGFKYIGGLIAEWEKTPQSPHFVFGGEESYGYLVGTEARDKDAIISGALVCEAALQAKLKGDTLWDVWLKILREFGIYHEKLISLQFPETKIGRQQMSNSMEKLRRDPPHTIGGYAVHSIEDYQRSIKTDLQRGLKEPITLPQSDILLFWLEDKSKVIVRPSGTEPKVKVYVGIGPQDDLAKATQQAEHLGNAVRSWAFS